MMTAEINGKIHRIEGAAWWNDKAGRHMRGRAFCGETGDISEKDAPITCPKCSEIHTRLTLERLQVEP